ncbi:MAG TPA: phosphoglucomutase/phosphomannomutase family protein [Verrucomicrobiae bacterium]|nr:phosphoglucomutase/phosphomannomutase family protein [Verrucomicrobiae bacterium]
MQTTQIKFGTDGWRGVIAEDFTFENVRRVAQATADYWNSFVGTQRAAIVGYDNRFLSETYAKLVCEVLAANGIQALYPPLAAPTPAVTFAVRDRKLCGAVMITASHNPPRFNGYKLKAHYAGPADPQICGQVEARVDQSPVRTVDFDEGVKNHRIEIYDPCPAHEAAARKIVDFKRIQDAKLHVIVDSMHGCGSRVLEEMLGGTSRRAGRAPVTTIRANRDPLFGGMNPEPIGKNLGPLCDAVKKSRAAIGLATDGDADRVGVVDDHGRYVSIQLVIAVLLLHLLRNREEKTGVVVKSTNCTVLIDRICEKAGLKCVEVPVGFKYICEQMRERDVLIGGEESGGIGFHGHIPERDGIVASLMLLEMLAVMKKPLSRIVRDLQNEFGTSEYDRIDMPFPLEKREQLIETLRSQPPRQLVGVPLARTNDSDGVKYIAKDDSWLMFRTSGTEPIIRIYSEAATADRVKKLLEHGKSLALKLGR